MVGDLGQEDLDLELRLLVQVQVVKVLQEAEESEVLEGLVDQEPLRHLA